MAEDLDDGELWLPADIIPDVVGLPRNGHVSPLSSLPRHSFGHYHHLADRLAALALLDRAAHHHLHPTQPTHLHHRLTPSLHFRPAHIGRSATTNAYILGGGGGGGGSRPVHHQFVHAKPCPVHVEGFGQTRRTRVLERLQQGGVVPDRGYPVRVAGFGREGGGTGVFLPRVMSSDVRKKTSIYCASGIKGGEQQKQATRNAVVARQGMSFQPQSDIVLPQDWTY